MVMMTATCLHKLHSFLKETIYSTGYLVFSENENSTCLGAMNLNLLRHFFCQLSPSIFFSVVVFVVLFLFSQQVYGILKLIGQVISGCSRIPELCKHVY